LGTSRIRSGVRPKPAASHQVLFNFFLLCQDVASVSFLPEAGENILFKASSFRFKYAHSGAYVH